MTITEVKQFINSKFSDCHFFDIIVDPDSDTKCDYLAIIAHENIQKDIWILGSDIDSVILVPYDYMGTDEQIRWDEYQKGIK